MPHLNGAFKDFRMRNIILFTISLLFFYSCNVEDIDVAEPEYVDVVLNCNNSINVGETEGFGSGLKTAVGNNDLVGINILDVATGKYIYSGVFKGNPVGLKAKLETNKSYGISAVIVGEGKNVKTKFTDGVTHYGKPFSYSDQEFVPLSDINYWNNDKHFENMECCPDGHGASEDAASDIFYCNINVKATPDLKNINLDFKRASYKFTYIAMEPLSGLYIRALCNSDPPDGSNYYVMTKESDTRFSIVLFPNSHGDPTANPNDTYDIHYQLWIRKKTTAVKTFNAICGKSYQYTETLEDLFKALFNCYVDTPGYRPQALFTKSDRQDEFKMSLYGSDILQILPNGFTPDNANPGSLIFTPSEELKKNFTTNTYVDRFEISRKASVSVPESEKENNYLEMHYSNYPNVKYHIYFYNP